jgi:hypothetical protein
MKTITICGLTASWVSTLNRRLMLIVIVLVLSASFSNGDVSAQNLAWTPQQRINGVGSSNGASLAVFANRLFAAWKGVPGDNRMFWSSFDGRGWSPQQPGVGGGTSNGPSLAVFNGRLFAAWKGVPGDNRMFWSSFDGRGWSPQQPGVGGGTSNGPSLAVFNGRLFAIWKGMNNDPGIYYSSLVPATAPPSTCAHCNDGSCQCGNKTGGELCASHGGQDPAVGCIQEPGPNDGNL